MVLEPQSAAAQKYLEWFKGYTNNPQATVADIVNLAFYGHGHQHLYTADELGGILQAVGFTAIRAMPGGTYGHPVFNGVDGHGRVVGEEINAIEAVAFENVKP
jgi:hypothetical protein